MRLVHLCYSGTSGATRAALNIARGSARASRHAYVLFGVEPVRPDYEQELRGYGCAWTYVPKRRGFDPRAYGRAARAVLEARAEVAVLHGSRLFPVVLRMGGRRGAPLRIAVQHGPSLEITSLPRRMGCTVFSWLAHRTVTVSQDMAALIGRYPILRRACRPLAVIPNGIDTSWWQAPPPEPSRDGTLRIGMVATLELHKDHATLLRAVRLLVERGCPIQLQLVGAGPQEPVLKGLAQELNLSSAVTFEGNVTQPEVRRIVHGLDILVHASRSESFGLAVLEGMAAARPIVAADTPGVRELVRDGQTGLLVPERSPEALADAITRLHGDPELARRLALAAQADAVQKFSAAGMAQAYEDTAGALVWAR